MDKHAFHFDFRLEFVGDSVFFLGPSKWNKINNERGIEKIEIRNEVIAMAFVLFNAL